MLFTELEYSENFVPLPFTGVQDGRPLDLLHQSDVNHHEPALGPGAQQVIFSLAGGKRAAADFAPCWSTMQLVSHLRPPAVDHEPQSLRRVGGVTGHLAELHRQQHLGPWWWWWWRLFWRGLPLRHHGTLGDVDISYSFPRLYRLDACLRWRVSGRKDFCCSWVFVFFYVFVSYLMCCISCIFAKLRRLKSKNSRNLNTQSILIKTNK